jgi:hypothetical protein
MFIKQYVKLSINKYVKMSASKVNVLPPTRAIKNGAAALFYTTLGISIVMIAIFVLFLIQSLNPGQQIKIRTSEYKSDQGINAPVPKTTIRINYAFEFTSSDFLTWKDESHTQNAFVDLTARGLAVSEALLAVDPDAELPLLFIPDNYTDASATKDKGLYIVSPDGPYSVMLYNYGMISANRGEDNISIKLRIDATENQQTSFSFLHVPTYDRLTNMDWFETLNEYALIVEFERTDEDYMITMTDTGNTTMTTKPVDLLPDIIEITVIIDLKTKTADASLVEFGNTTSLARVSLDYDKNILFNSMVVTCLGETRLLMMSTNGTTSTTADATIVVEPKDISVLKSTSDGEYEGAELTNGALTAESNLVLFVPMKRLIFANPRQFYATNDTLVKCIGDSLEIVLDGTVTCSGMRVHFVHAGDEMIQSNSVDWVGYSADNYNRHGITIQNSSTGSQLLPTINYVSFATTSTSTIPVMVDVVPRNANSLAINIDLLQLQTTVVVYNNVFMGPGPNGLCLFDYVVIEFLNTPQSKQVKCDIKSITVSKKAHTAFVVTK